MMSPYVYLGLDTTIRRSVDDRATFDRVLDLVAGLRSCSRSEILSRRRFRGFILCRQFIVAIMRDHFGTTYKRLGLFLRRDHSTIVHQYRRHGEDYATSDGYRLTYDNIRPQIIFALWN